MTMKRTSSDCPETRTFYRTRVFAALYTFVARKHAGETCCRTLRELDFDLVVRVTLAIKRTHVWISWIFYLAPSMECFLGTRFVRKELIYIRSCVLSCTTYINRHRIWAIWLKSLPLLVFIYRLSRYDSVPRTNPQSRLFGYYRLST